MSENTVSRAEFGRALRQSQRRKQELATLQAEHSRAIETLQTLQAERDEAIQEMESITQQFTQFTDENELYRTNKALANQLKERDLIDAFSQLPDGMGYQDGVTLQDILDASGKSLDEIDEIDDEFVTDAIARAQTAKPYLFTRAEIAHAADAAQGDVRPETAQASTFKAFGAQAVGGGSAPDVVKPDPAKSVDWSDAMAVQRFAQSRDSKP